MTKVIGVRFRRAGKIYFFAPGKLLLRQQGALNMAMLFLEYVMLNMRRLYSL